MTIRKIRDVKIAVMGAALAGGMLFFGSASAVSVGVPPQGLENNGATISNQGPNGGPVMTEGDADSSGSVPLKGEEPWRYDPTRPHHTYIHASTRHHHHLRHDRHEEY